MSSVVKAGSKEAVSLRVQELTYLLASVQLGDWWILLETESREILEELEQFLRVPCGNEVHDRRSEQGIICIQRELLQRRSSYEMGVDFVSRDDLPDTIPVMSVTVDGWSVYSGAEGESPTLEDFFVDRARADAAVAERDEDGELVLFDAFVFDAILLPEGLVTSNDFEIKSHDDLRKRIEAWRQRGGLEEDS